MTKRSSQTVCIEIAVDSVASAVAAERGGAARLELCANLLEGGVTPSAGMIAATRAASIGVHVMIRPRGGDFSYDHAEIDVMARDIAMAKSLAADGVVLGLLKTNGRIDLDRTRRLVDLARPLEVTFHRAFDMSADLLESLEDVCATGADRLLTSGGEANCLDGLQTIAALVKAARGRIAIMAGGGVRPENAARIIAATGVRDIHAGLSTVLERPVAYRNPRVSMGKAQGREYERHQVTEAIVRQLRESIAETDVCHPE
ncbi:MAG: copper homeostasis protein CutC [Candidatus Sulfotelmatobacter sp.]